jgi:Holliday junction resolvasome RuvABC DNA-binding subunit
MLSERAMKLLYGSVENYKNTVQDMEDRIAAAALTYTEEYESDDDYTIESTDIDSTLFDDAVSGLQSLGYKKKDAERSVTDAIDAGVDTIDGIIKAALNKRKSVTEAPSVKSDVVSDSISALMALGYKKRESDKLVDSAINSGITNIEDIIKFALSKAKVS